MLYKKKMKKEIIKINNIDDLNRALENEGLNINTENEEKFKEGIKELFNLDSFLSEEIYKTLKKGEITYRSKNIKEFIDYIEKISLFEDLNNKLGKEIIKMKNLIIDRVEYESDDDERVKTYNYDVNHILNAIEEIKEDISSRMSEKDMVKLENIEKELGEEIIFSKDIEIVKKMILTKENKVEETYDENTRVKRMIIEISKEINKEYIKPKKGSIEYYHHINANIPRISRLIKNLNKYVEVYNLDEGIFRINQSDLVQDTVNLAFATFNNVEFKAISGSNEVDNYSKNQKYEDIVFESYNVNRLGNLGLGYNRINDSEKKIFEEIYKKIEKNILESEGEVILYTKLEPCPSCYFVIVQFLDKYPKIKVKVKYNKKYGE